MNAAAPTKAVFLSYASQDADAARRIGEALRSADIEVWLDTSELRWIGTTCRHWRCFPAGCVPGVCSTHAVRSS